MRADSAIMVGRELSLRLCSSVKWLLNEMTGVFEIAMQITPFAPFVMGVNVEKMFVRLRIIVSYNARGVRIVWCMGVESTVAHPSGH